MSAASVKKTPADAAKPVKKRACKKTEKVETNAVEAAKPVKKRDGNPLQYSCLENPMDRGAWRVTVLGSQSPLI